MLIDLLNIYLILVIAFAVVASYVIIKNKPPTLKTVLLTGGLVFVLPAVLGYLYFTQFSSLPEQLVPDLRGMTLEQAEETLTTIKLQGRHAGSVFDDNLPEGLVVSQRPEAGRKVKIGRLVSLLTSSGQRKVIVPSLLGRPASQAEAVLQAKGLLLGEIIKDFVAEMDPGIILIQSPLPEEEVEVGTEVRITVSTTEEGGSGQGRAREEKEGQGAEQGGFRFPWW